MGVRRFTDLRAWQACDLYKKAVYALCANGPLARDFELRDQIKDSVAGPPSHIAEGFGRFDPPDFARFARMASSSLMESQNHLRDAVDRKHITEEARLTLEPLAQVAIEEVTGLITYLQSPQALLNARRVRERRIARTGNRKRRTRNRTRNTNNER